MKNFIELLEKLYSENAYTQDRIYAVEIAAKLIEDIRKTGTYKAEKEKIFSAKGEQHTEKTAIVGSRWGWTIRQTYKSAYDAKDNAAIVKAAIDAGLISQEWADSVPKKHFSESYTYKPERAN